MIIAPLIRRIGITSLGMTTYRTLWFIAINSARTIGLPGTIYICWQLRRFLLGRISPRMVVNLLTSYLPTITNSSVIRTIYRLSRNNNNYPFVRIINYIILSTFINIFNFIFKRILFYFGFAFISSIFSIITTVLGIFWIPQLRDIQSLLNFAFKMKE